MAGMVAAMALTPAAHAQVPGRAYYDPQRSLSSNRAALQPSVTSVSLGVSTTVSVPDGGSTVVGSYSRVSESRSEYGAPVVSKLPYASRGLRNVSYGRSTVSSRIVVSARIIDLREEEYRQTGYRSP
jgi:general secretion pathway protein D